MSLSSINHQGFSKQVMEEAYSSSTTVLTFSDRHRRSYSVVMSGKKGTSRKPKANQHSSDYLATECNSSYDLIRKWEDTLLNEEDVESLDHEEVHEYVEEVEEENEDQEAEDIDHERQG
ncbi:hypothetical protein PIB30_059803 [Stylosanthes scabra]|uniref:Uncharacterized protein n=1 Tax=Stylosanthes scabra TaxID=79078 RepID=A0ABU6YHT7_9FABA|nr:hypothetical protein [Stylosanthes scabra]